MTPPRRSSPRSARGSRTPEVEASARARRARDHLARKRERERVRLERERSRAEIAASRRRVLRVLSPIAFVVAIGLGAILAVPIAEWLVLGGRPVERIAVQGARTLPVAAIAAGTGITAGVALDEIDPESVRRALVASPWIEDARAMRLPTGTLLVRILERDAIARWRVADTTSWVDATGNRFSESVSTVEQAPVDETPGRPPASFASAFPPRGLPMIEGPAAEAGVLPDEALLILRELRRHPALAADPAALTLHLPRFETDAAGVPRDGASGFVLQLGDSGPRAVLGRRLFSQRVARLAALLAHDADTARTARLIDLRYADRAVLEPEAARDSGPDQTLSDSTASRRRADPASG